MRARDDERWQQAQADYIAEHSDLDSDERFRVRLAAAARMYEIETAN